MIQFSDLTKLETKDIPNLLSAITPELEARKELWRRYHRKDKEYQLVFDGARTKVTFEKYIVDIASGFLGGKEPTYTVNDTADQDRIKAIKEVIGKIIGVKGYADKMKALIEYISKYNDDGTEHYELVKDMLMLRSCYELVYENQNNEIVYSRLDPLQTMAIWDYNVPCNLIGIVRTWTESNINGVPTVVVELTDINGTRRYTNADNQGFTEEKDKQKPNTWGDVPAFAVETTESIFEPVVNLIQAYEQLVQNTRNMFQYNDEAKLAINGYQPENELTKVDDNGNIVPNEARQKEDALVLASKVMYFGEGGDAKWIEKNINDSAIQNTLKTYIDLIMMNAGVPNTFDLGFTNADNASALDRKFFSLISMTVNIMQQLRKGYLRRWELIFNRINIKKNTDFDFRDIVVDTPINQPANESELIDMWLKLRGVISDETLVNRLPLNIEYASEKQKIDNEQAENIEQNLEAMKKLGKEGDNEPTLQGNRQETKTNEEEV